MNQIMRRISFVIAVVLGGFLAFRLLDLLMVWFLYSWFFQTIRSASGMPDTLNGAFSIWLVAITLMLLPTFFSVLFWKRDVKKVLLVVSAVSAWLVIVYFMSLPQEGRFFNPITGQAMYRYSQTPDGKIDLFPLGYKFHPRYGTKLELVTPEVMKEMEWKAKEVIAAQERERKRQEAETLAVQEQEKQRRAAEAVAAQERERQRQAAEQAVAQKREWQRKTAETVAAQERERQRQATEQAVFQKRVWQRKTAETVAAQERERRKQIDDQKAVEVKAAQELEKERKRQEAETLAVQEQEKQRRAAEAVAAQERERQRQATEAALPQRLAAKCGLVAEIEARRLCLNIVDLAVKTNRPMTLYTN